jgi:linoleoyl-CoA desaturase
MKLGIVDFLIGYSVVVFVCGLVIAVVFQLAHIYENAEFILPKNDHLTIETEWAVHQINTTSNFATGNKLVRWFWGGLNFQVEHHLFPKISHIHYPEISKIVKQTCSEFNLDYKEFPTVISALRSHLVHLRKLGNVA